MQTLITPTGIKVLLPQVPIDARGFCKRHDGTIVYLHGQGMENMHGFIDLEFDKHTILGTCWREGGKLICDFDPAQLVDPVIERAYGESYLDYSPEFYPGKSGFVGTAIESWDSWLISQVVEIKEGHKIVIIKVE